MTFDPYGPLPTGTTVLEASAGTGKTWTIATLATRYVAEGHADLSQLLLATFSRAATQELRERVRERLAVTLRGLAGPDACDDPLVRHLRAAPQQEVDERRLRLVRALSDFDRATIATTHSFCQQVLDGLGMSGDHDPGVTVVESVDDLLREVVDDLYLRTFASHGAAPPAITPKDARDVARAAVADRQARLEPVGADASSSPGQRVALAQAAVLELERRKRTAGVRDYDDLLVLLRDVLTDPLRGPAACRRLRAQYAVVLVDEFQDTDPVQWEILRTAFSGHTTLVLIGDPKQAVYAFRGAEVLSYLQAVREADHHEALGTNWRSDAGLLRALDHLYGGAALGHSAIVVRPVEPRHTTSRLHGAVPLRLRVLGRTGAGPLGRSGFPAVSALRERVADDVAADVVRLLTGDSVLELDAPRPVQPGDVAVLVRKHGQAALVAAALERAGVPSVVSSSTSVFTTPSARDWLWLLEALEQPHRAGRVRLAALTPLLGWTAAQLDAAADHALDEVGELLREAVRRFDEAGLAAAFEQLSARTRLESRVLGLEQGERRMTDLRHLAQVLDRAAVEESLGLSALVAWLAERVEDPDTGALSERSRRLETDAAAVQVVTVHTSKGLEFPVVLVPFGWDSTTMSAPATLRLHDPSGARVLDVGGKDGPGWAARKKQAEAEDDAEELRLLYVALTRAQCQVVAWWAPSYGGSASPLQRLLLGRRAGEAEPAARAPVPEDAAALAALRAWGWPDEIAVEAVDAVEPQRYTRAAAGAGALVAAQFDRSLDTVWRRTSYSALTSAAHDTPSVGSEPEAPERSDEPDGASGGTEQARALDGGAGEGSAPGATADGGPPSPMNGLPAGAAFGTLVHEVLERLDTAADDLAAELLLRCRQAVAQRLAAVDPAALAAALLPVLHTPLGPGSTGSGTGTGTGTGTGSGTGSGTGGGALTLARVAPRDRLAELDFELPLSGGDTPTAVQAHLRGVAALLRRHLPADDVLAPYADLLETVDAPPLRGYLAGSIDAVLRLAGPSYVVVDYKTNRLGRGDLTALHYTREAMAAEMLRAHYPLQALLYAVALHRFLRWRQPGYDPERHLGGVQYLFVRGMVGPETPPGCGVFDWRPPPRLVHELSELLAGA